MFKCVKGLQWTAGKHTEGNGRKHLKPVALSTNAKGDFIIIIINIIHLYYTLKKGFHFWTSDLFSLYSSRFFDVFFYCESAGLHSSDAFTCHVEFKADKKGNRRLKMLLCYKVSAGNELSTLTRFTR